MGLLTGWWRRRRAKAALKEARWQLARGTLKQAEDQIERASACWPYVDTDELAAVRLLYSRHYHSVSATRPWR